MHIWGTMLVGLDLLTDWQDLDTPLRVQTAKGTLTLTQLATMGRYQVTTGHQNTSSTAARGICHTILGARYASWGL